jgi:hypothetical protein
VRAYGCLLGYLFEPIIMLVLPFLIFIEVNVNQILGLYSRISISCSSFHFSVWGFCETTPIFWQGYLSLKWKANIRVSNSEIHNFEKVRFPLCLAANLFIY